MLPTRTGTGRPSCGSHAEPRILSSQMSQRKSLQQSLEQAFPRALTVTRQPPILAIRAHARGPPILSHCPHRHNQASLYDVMVGDVSESLEGGQLAALRMADEDAMRLFKVHESPTQGRMGDWRLSGREWVGGTVVGGGSAQCAATAPNRHQAENRSPAADSSSNGSGSEAAAHPTSVSQQTRTPHYSSQPVLKSVIIGPKMRGEGY